GAAGATVEPWIRLADVTREVEAVALRERIGRAAPLAGPTERARSAGASGRLRLRLRLGAFDVVGRLGTGGGRGRGGGDRDGDLQEAGTVDSHRKGSLLGGGAYVAKGMPRPGTHL